MQVLQVREKGKKEWLPFESSDSPFFDARKMMDGINKNYPNIESRTVEVAQTVLPHAVQERINILKERFHQVEITHASEQGVLVKFIKHQGLPLQEEAWGNIIAWDGTLLGAGDYRIEETIFTENNQT